MPLEYPPYVTGYGGIPTLFKKIKEAAVPAKFTQDFPNRTLFPAEKTSVTTTTP